MLHLKAAIQLSSCVRQLQARLLSVSTCCCGRKSRDPYDKRGVVSPKDVSPEIKHGGTRDLERRIAMRDDMPQPTGYYDAQNNFVEMPEMIPEFVVPDLAGFELKPYVSYRVPDITQSEFTAKDLFDALYTEPVMEDYRKRRFDADTVSKEDLIAKIESKLKKS